MKSTARSTAISAIVASVAGSTAAQDYPWLSAYLEQALHGAQGRSEGIGVVNERRREVSDAQRGLIRAAVKLAPLSMPLRELLTIIRTRLGDRGKAIGDWTIKDELRQLREEAAEASDTESRPTLCGSTLESSEQTSEDQREQGEREGQGAGEGIADHQA